MIVSISNYVSKIASKKPAISALDFQLRPRLDHKNLSDRLIELELPTDICKLLYADCDGQEYGGLKLFGEFAMLPFQNGRGGIDALEMYFELVRSFAEAEMGGSPDNRIRGETIWRRRWYPFAWDQNNNDHLCLDFDPTDYGSLGQVIYCPQGRNLSVVAASFPAFLSWYFDKLVEEGFAIESVFNEFECRVNPNGSHQAANGG